MVMEKDMAGEKYPCYVRVGAVPNTTSVTKLLTEADGTMLLSTLTKRFRPAIGLKFQGPTGAWRGVRCSKGVLAVPLEGWGDRQYTIAKAENESLVVTNFGAKKQKLAENVDSNSKSKQSTSTAFVPRTVEKQKLDATSAPTKKASESVLGGRQAEQHMIDEGSKETSKELLVLGVPYAATREHVMTYFSQFGKVAHCELKCDDKTNLSRGFGYVQYASAEMTQWVLRKRHWLCGQELEVRVLNNEGNAPVKLLVGMLPEGTTLDELKKCFLEYDPLEVSIPQHLRRHGLITLRTEVEAREVKSSRHVINGVLLKDIQKWDFSEANG